MSKKAESDLTAAMAATVAGEPGVFSAAAVELPAGRRWLLNPKRLRSASLIKIFILAEAFRRIGRGELDPEEAVAIPAEAIVGGAGQLEFAAPGTVRTWRELLEAMIVESDNTATNMVIDRLGMESVNALAVALGCRDTVLRRKMMDFAAAAAGRENYTTPADVAAVLARLYRRECVSPAADEAMVAILLRQEDRCKLPLLLPAAAKVACKSGELDGAEHDAGIVYGEGHDYVLAVMSDGLPDEERGRGVIAQLSRTVYDWLHSNISA
ncbi:serine hydrolase [Anaeroselena agilis]|uniref:Serine hydrolase n=1 Tax=Anaeroselena agilis TaxID=3063788 RepID=A0ABU3NY30_9FIRM|nr:serine hydrolase [Selenomonadales bacterium 4137-cl]